MTQRLSGKHALLTGAAGGIGLAVATAYLRDGAKCTVADIGKAPTPELAAVMAAPMVVKALVRFPVGFECSDRHPHTGCGPVWGRAR